MKYFLGALGGLLVIILLVVLIVGGGDNNNVPADEVKRLTDYAPESSETMYTIGGPISAEETHRQVRITVTNAQRTIEVIDGYNGNVLRTETYPNTTASYEAFLAAIEQVGFSKTRRSDMSFTSVCPTGRRYSYALNNGDEKVVDTWSATCERGTFGGKTNATERLFQAQIPDYQEVTRDVRFALQ